MVTARRQKFAAESYLYPFYPPQIKHALAMTSIYASLVRDL